MKRTLFAAALLLGGLFLTTSQANAQSVDFGIRIGNGRSGVSIGVHSNDRYDHRRGGDWGRRGPVWGGPVYRGPVYRDDCRCDRDRDYGYEYRQETIEVVVYETVWVREYDRYSGRTFSVQREVPVRYIARWDGSGYFYLNNYGQRLYVR